MTRQERRSNRDVKQIAAQVMGLAYGPSECRREDADEYLAVKINAGGLIAQSTLFDSHQVIPVCYGYTRNRAIRNSGAAMTDEALHALPLIGVYTVALLAAFWLISRRKG